MRTLTLVLMRHGQAEFLNPDGDSSRALTPRGQAQARETGKFFTSYTLTPAVALVSGATRTRETAAQLRTLLPNTEWRTVEGLYLASPRSTLEIVLAQSLEAHDSLLLLGHNPGFSELASQLSGIRVGLDTAAAAWLETEASSWEEGLQLEGLWRLRELIHPGI